MRLLPKVRDLINAEPDLEPIEAVSVMVICSLEIADQFSKHSPHEGVSQVLDDMWEIYVQNN